MLTSHEKVLCVAVSNSNGHVASSSEDGTIRVLSVPFEQQQPTTLDSESGEVTSVCFKIDENCLFSGSVDGTVGVWTLVNQTWTQAAKLPGHTDPVNCINVSESGRFVVSGAMDKTARVWEYKDGKWITTAIMQHNYAVIHVAISETMGRVVSACYDYTLTIHELGGQT